MPTVLRFNCLKCNCAPPWQGKVDEINEREEEKRRMRKAIDGSGPEYTHQPQHLFDRIFLITMDVYTTLFQKISGYEYTYRKTKEIERERDRYIYIYIKIMIEMCVPTPCGFFAHVT